ncbi:Cytochrome c551/c552 [Actinokineospora spheciospongiae]|uniref:Cytochrome c551/c552 n=1 Tax=Actinokineospora spheciospongiae TaxID=909613 RepID=W7ITQ1_9PSEU|nr:ricin-type beta-trefoil lectin domain protein [Actinokineospora spheciospongiae]EWC59771.1 Cytochrome c551/c552 [Actinokineospora spheciospongiae]
MDKQRFRRRAVLALGAALVLSGAVVVSTGSVSATESAQAPAAPAPVAVTKRIAVVLVDFTDDRIDSSAAFRAKVRDMYFGADTSLARYYREASNGALDFAPLAGQPEVIGPLAIGVAAGCDSGAMNSKTRQALSAKGISGFDSLAIWFPNRLAKCGWGGLGQQPGPTTWMPDNATGTPPSGVVHELGHNLGFRHLSAKTCTAGTLSDCVDADYRGSSPMGGGGYRSGLSAPELLHMGWLPAAQLITAPASGTYTLVPLHAPDSTPGTRVLEIPRSGTERITVAYRRNGNTLDTGVGEGVQLHLTTQGAYHTSTLVDPSAATTGKDDTDLDVGARVTDAANGITVETVSAGATSATVRITTKGAPPAGRTLLGAGGRCLDVKDQATTNGTRAILWDCHGGANQRWTTGTDGTLRSLGKCLDVEAGGTADGTRVILWDCHGRANQRWTADADGTLRSLGKCLDARTAANGALLVVTTCAGSATQKWTTR